VVIEIQKQDKGAGIKGKKQGQLRVNNKAAKIDSHLWQFHFGQPEKVQQTH
jgi:hypothetical protein